MSTRPMVWSKVGVDKMAQLRAYVLNKGDLLELVRQQKKEDTEKKEEVNPILSSAQILESEQNRHGILGKYMECIHYIFATQKKKQVYFQLHIWGL